MDVSVRTYLGTLRRSLLYLLCVSNHHLYKKTSGSCSAWVNQGYSENTTENVIVKSGKDNLSDFQKDKFCHFFSHVLDQDSDQVICKGIYWLPSISISASLSHHFLLIFLCGSCHLNLASNFEMFNYFFVFCWIEKDKLLCNVFIEITQPFLYLDGASKFISQQH